jgi:hypothetical protein
MSCIIIPTPASDSVLDAKIVSQIQSALSTLAWLDACYGIAESSEMKKDDGSIEKFPRIYSNLSTKEYTDVRYDDSLKAQIFFERNGEIEFGNDSEIDEVAYSLSLVCWANLNKIDPGRNYDFTDMLAGDVLRILRENFESNISDKKQVELRAENAYSKYTMKDVENRFITLPYTAFRISFTYTEFQSGACYEFTPIGGTPC